MSLHSSQESAQNFATGGRSPSMTRLISASSNLRKVPGIPPHAMNAADSTWISEGDLSKVFVTASAPSIHSSVQQTATGGRVMVTETRRVETPTSSETQLVRTNEWSEDLPVTVTTNTFDTTYRADGTMTTTCRPEGREGAYSQVPLYVGGTSLLAPMSNIGSSYAPQYVSTANTLNESNFFTSRPTTMLSPSLSQNRLVSSPISSGGAWRVSHSPTTVVSSIPQQGVVYPPRVSSYPATSRTLYSGPTTTTYSTKSYSPVTTTVSGSTVWPPVSSVPGSVSTSASRRTYVGNTYTGGAPIS